MKKQVKQKYFNVARKSMGTTGREDGQEEESGGVVVYVSWGWLSQLR